MRYGFASEYGARDWRTHTTFYSTWDDVRYELELKHRMHSGGKRWARCCVFAMWFDDWIASGRKFEARNSVRGMTSIKNDSRLVLFRRPYPASLARNGAYIPTSFRPLPSTQKNKEEMTEDEMIVAVGSVTTLRKPGEFVHPAEYDYKGMNPIPHPKYTCNGCNAVGDHFRSDCPTNTTTVDFDLTKSPHRALDRVPRPHGIPKSFLRKVSEKERGVGVMRDESGAFYVFNNNNNNNNKEAALKRQLPLELPSRPKNMELPADPEVKEPSTSWGLMHMLGVEYDENGNVMTDADSPPTNNQLHHSNSNSRSRRHRHRRSGPNW